MTAAGRAPRFVAVGLLSASNTPAIPGPDRFAGRVLHTGHWPHEGVDLSGRRVAVIGTGSSGVQVIPEAAREVFHAQGDREFVRQQAEVSVAGHCTAGTGRSALEDTPEERAGELGRRREIGRTAARPRAGAAPRGRRGRVPAPAPEDLAAAAARP